MSLLCPRGCGTRMEMAQELQCGACRYCQTALGMGGLQHGQTVGGSAGYPMPNQLMPNYQSAPMQQPQHQQMHGNYPPHVQVVAQRTPEEINQMRIERGMAPLPLPEKKSAPAQMPAPAPSEPIAIQGVASLLEDCDTKAQAFLEAWVKLAYAIRNGKVHASGVIAQEEPATVPMPEPTITPPPSVAMVPPNKSGNGRKLTCNACMVESIGAQYDPNILSHTCEKGNQAQVQR